MGQELHGGEEVQYIMAIPYCTYMYMYMYMHVHKYAVQCDQCDVQYQVHMYFNVYM